MSASCHGPARTSAVKRGRKRWDPLLRYLSDSFRSSAARALCIAACLVLPGACSTVPTQGPTRQAVIDGGTRPDAPYLLMPISDFTVQELSHFPGPSLYGKFGDYRKPALYTVGVGDTIDVSVFEAAGGGLFQQPVTTQNSTGSHSAQIPPQVVQRDGSITVPYAGRVSVVGKTTPEIEKTIVTQLTGKAIEPQAIVTIDKSLSNAITVNGEVVRGQRLQLSTRGDRMIDVIAEAGGLNAPANETFLELTRGGKTVEVPFQSILNNPRENIYARPGDTLTVVRYPLTYTAVGATSRNAVITFDAVGISLEEAIAKAQGLLDLRADPEGVFVLRYEPVAVVRNFPGLTPAQAALNLVPVIYYTNMREPRALFLARKFAVHDKDIVYVSNSPFSDLQKLLQLVGTISAPVVSGIAASAYIR